MPAENLSPKERRIRRQLERADQKAFSRTGVHPDFAKLRRLRIQTAHPLLRLLLVGVGLGIVGGAFWMWSKEDSPTWTLLLSLFGLALLILGIRGRKQEVDKVFEKLGDASADKILEGLIDGL